MTSLRSTLLALSVRVTKGYVTAHLPLANTELVDPAPTAGLLHLRMKNAHIFFENGHNGDPNLSYVTVQIDRVYLYHKG